MIYRFDRDQKDLSELSKMYEEPRWYNCILSLLPEETNILRWEGADDYFYAEFNNHPGDTVANYGELIDDYNFEPLVKLEFDMQKMWDLGKDEHPTVTIEHLKMACINYVPNIEGKKVVMTVFDGCHNIDLLPEWVKTIA